MNNSEDRSQPEDNQRWSAFEQQLRSRTLGSGRQKRDGLLYHCGFAAGAAETKKQQQRSVRRWQALSVAASLFACFALASNSLSIQSNKESLQASVPSKITPEKNAAIAADGGSELWSALVTLDRPSVEHRQQTTHIGMSLKDSDANGIEDFIVPASQNSNGILRPKDFQLLLGGDA